MSLLNDKGCFCNNNLSLCYNQSLLNTGLASIAIDHGFEPRLDKEKTDYIAICCFTAKY